MNIPHVSRRLVAGAYRMVRIVVRLIFVLVLLALVLFVYLRIQGVPGPLLREIMSRANEAGIPVSVEGITLTLGGWRADHVRYYSNQPDDLEAIFQAKSVFFSVQWNGAEGVDVEVVVEGVTMEPSVDWGVAIPEGSAARRVGRVEVVLAFKPDRVVLSDGAMEWLGCRFNVNGTILKRMGAPPPKWQATVFPVQVTATQFQALEDRLEMLSLPTGATIDIDFKVDTKDYSKSRLDFAVQAKEPAFREVGFSEAEIVGSYAYPELRLERAALFDGKQSMQVSGEYSFESRQIKGTVYNSIASNRPLQLLPTTVREWLEKAELRIDYLPRLEINFGPALAKELPNHLSGAFTIRGASYQGLEIERLSGQLKRANNRIEFTNLQGSVRGQEHRAKEVGSALQGGTVEGEVFWDQNTREFGLKADLSLDPHLLVQPLAPVTIATDIIQYFSFKDQPPRGHLELGAMVDDWSTFYIDIRALANEASFRGVAFSSINVTETYRNGRLKLDPFAVLQGADFAKGAIELDFHNTTVSFDAESTLDPTALEAVIYPGLDLFKEKIKTQGDVRVSAQGMVDWGSMRRTDFSAKVFSKKVAILVGVADDFHAEIIGKGPLLTVRDAVFSLYGGQGGGSFSIRLDPAQKSMPYEINTSFSKVDFMRFVEFCRPGEVSNVSGKLSGRTHVKADMATNFFSMANGSASLRVDDGQLADLPLFKGFTKVVRSVIPGFDTFSITSMDGDFTITHGKIASKMVRFHGDAISATARGSYHPDSGFDAYVQTHVLRGGGLGKLVRLITDPLLKFFEMRLTGPFLDPVWRLDKFTKNPFKEK